MGIKELLEELKKLVILKKDFALNYKELRIKISIDGSCVLKVMYDNYYNIHRIQSIDG